MLRLSYTQQDLMDNALLQSTVQTLIMIGATVSNWPKLSFEGDYKLDTRLLPFVDVYKCFIKMQKSDWQWEVYIWLEWRETIVSWEWEPEQTKVLTWSEWKSETFDEPMEDKAWEFVYIPSDIRGEELSWESINIFVENWCALLNIPQYTSRLNSEYPQDILL